MWKTLSALKRRLSALGILLAMTLAIQLVFTCVHLVIPYPRRVLERASERANGDRDKNCYNRYKDQFLERSRCIVQIPCAAPLKGETLGNSRQWPWPRTLSCTIYRVHEMKVFQDIKPSRTRKALLNRKGQNCFVPERATCIILSSACCST